MNMRIRALNKLINIGSDPNDIADNDETIRKGQMTPQVYVPNPRAQYELGIEQAANAIQPGDQDVSNRQFNQIADEETQNNKMAQLVKEYEDMKAMGFNVRDPRLIMNDINAQNPVMNAQKIRSNYYKKQGMK